jgi:hypothetical protein
MTSWHVTDNFLTVARKFPRPRLAASLASFGSLRLSIPMSHCYAMLSTDISIALDGIEPREVPAFLTFLLLGKRISRFVAWPEKRHGYV